MTDTHQAREALEPCREAFHAWIKSISPSEPGFTDWSRDPQTGGYQKTTMRGAWKAWEVCWNTRAAQPGESVTLRWVGSRLMLGGMMVGHAYGSSGAWMGQWQAINMDGATSLDREFFATESEARDWVYAALLAKLAGGG